MWVHPEVVEAHHGDMQAHIEKMKTHNGADNEAHPEAVEAHI